MFDVCVCCCLVRFWCSSGGDVQLDYFLDNSSPPFKCVRVLVVWYKWIDWTDKQHVPTLLSHQGVKSSMKVVIYSNKVYSGQDISYFALIFYEFVAKVSPSSARKAFPKYSSCPFPIFCFQPAHISLTNQTVQKTLSRWCVEEKQQELRGVLTLLIQKSKIFTWAWKSDPHSFWHHFLFSVQTNISFHEGLTHHLFLFPSSSIFPVTATCTPAVMSEQSVSDWIYGKHSTVQTRLVIQIQTLGCCVVNFTWYKLKQKESCLPLKTKILTTKNF